MNSHWTALNTTEFSYQIWSCPIFLPNPKRADWLMCFRLLRWIFMSLFWLVCRNLIGSYEFVLWWCRTNITFRDFRTTGRNIRSLICTVWKEAWGWGFRGKRICISQFDQQVHIYRAFYQVAWKFLSAADSNPRTWAWNFHGPGFVV